MRWIKWWAFVICSSLAVLSALLSVARVGSVDATVGRDIVLSGVAAAVVGGVSLFGGKGRLMHRTATMAFTEATIYDEAGKPCAHSTGTFKYVKRLPTGPKSANDLNIPPGTLSTD